MRELSTDRTWIREELVETQLSADTGVRVWAERRRETLENLVAHRVRWW